MIGRQRVQAREGFRWGNGEERKKRQRGGREREREIDREKGSKRGGKGDGSRGRNI